MKAKMIAADVVIATTLALATVAIGGTGDARAQAFEVAAHGRADVGIEHGGRGAFVFADLGRDFARDRAVDLRKLALDEFANALGRECVFTSDEDLKL